MRAAKRALVERNNGADIAARVSSAGFTRRDGAAKLQQPSHLEYARRTAVTSTVARTVVRFFILWPEALECGRSRRGVAVKMKLYDKINKYRLG